MNGIFAQGIPSLKVLIECPVSESNAEMQGDLCQDRIAINVVQYQDQFYSI
jgi:hypothetical protein